MSESKSPTVRSGNTNPTLIEMQKRKHEIESDILDLLRGFEEAFDVPVEDVHVHTALTMRRTNVISVDLDVRL